MLWVLGSSREIRANTSGSMLSGIINPPIIIEGRKMSCDHSTVMRVDEEMTPINTPRPTNATTETRYTSTNPGQSEGRGASKKIGAVNVMIPDTMVVCRMVVRAGMMRIEAAGTPLIL